MRISRLRLHNVKRHADLTLEFAPGLTVVRGPNEAGKSTLQRAIEICLFRKPTSTAQELDGVRRWGAASDPRIELDFEEEGAEGELVKVFAGARGTVELRYEDAVLTDPGAVEEVITRLTGLPSERFYRATASIHHHELAGLDHDEQTLRDRLQQSMSGADRGTRAARRKLEDAARRYRSEGHKNPGYLKVARAEVERLTQAVAEGDAALAQLERDRQALADARDKRALAEDQLAQYRQALEASERALKLARRAEEAAQRYEIYKRAEELRTEVVALDAAHPSAMPLPELKAAVERIRNQEYRLSEIRAELAAEPDPSTWEASHAQPRWRLALAAAGMLAVLSVVGLLGGVLAGEALIGGVLAAVLAAGALVAGLVARRMRRGNATTTQQQELRDIDIARRLRGRSDLFEQVREVERARDEAVAALGLPDLAAAEALLEKESEHVARIDNLRAEMRGLLGEEPSADSYAEFRDAAANEVDECRHALGGMGKIGSEPEKSNQALKGAVERAGREREDAFNAEAQADARLAANGIDAEEVAALAESLSAQEERLAGLERRLRIYETILAALDEAERSTMKKAARFLEQRMATDVERITDGRYRRLRVDEAKLAFSVYSAESGDWVDALALSRGTIDQLYLCARLGIVRQVTQPASPPLVLDDPFVTFDDDRARRAVELLRSAAGEYQIILLTCSERYDDLAEKVIELPRPELRDDHAEAEAEAQADGVLPAAASAADEAATESGPVQVGLDLPIEPAVDASGNGHARGRDKLRSRVEER
ncbi:MAG TPA: AAA family ATPase [Candidatus Limnocylindria bacterium]|nr:AAA family ATPase [Candidatus Limnocylindria bacterium]